MSVQIDTGVPLPPERAYSVRFRYPFERMAVGDSFLCPDNHIKSVRAAAHQFGKRTTKRFVTRMTPDGLRVWRVQ